MNFTSARSSCASPEIKNSALQCEALKRVLCCFTPPAESIGNWRMAAVHIRRNSKVTWCIGCHIQHQSTPSIVLQEQMSFTAQDKSVERFYFGGSRVTRPISPCAPRVMLGGGGDLVSWLRCGVSSALTQVRSDPGWHWISRRVHKETSKRHCWARLRCHESKSTKQPWQDEPRWQLPSWSFFVCLSKISDRLSQMHLPHSLIYVWSPEFEKCQLGFILVHVVRFWGKYFITFFFFCLFVFVPLPPLCLSLNMLEPKLYSALF